MEKEELLKELGEGVYREFKNYNCGTENNLEELYKIKQLSLS